VVAKLDDAHENVRMAAIAALGQKAVIEEALRSVIWAKRGDSATSVALVVLSMMSLEAPFSESRPALERALGSDDNGLRPEARDAVSGLVEMWGKQAQQSEETYHWVRGLLHSPNRFLRQHGALILKRAGFQAVQDAKVDLVAALDDLRGYDSWPARLAAADLFLNEWQFTREALRVILEAQDYGVNPPIFSRGAPGVRRQAAMILGKLKAIDQYPEVTDRIRHLLETEDDSDVLDSLLSALQSLAAAPE